MLLTTVRYFTILIKKHPLTTTLPRIIINIKNTLPSSHIINDLNGEEIDGTFYNQTEVTVKKVIKRRGDNLYVKWKGYGNSFSTWFDEKGVA